MNHAHPQATEVHAYRSDDQVCPAAKGGVHEMARYDGGGEMRVSWWSPGWKHYGQRCTVCGFVSCEICPYVGYLKNEENNGTHPH